MFIHLNEATNHTVHISNHGALSTLNTTVRSLEETSAHMKHQRDICAPSATYHSYSTAKGFEVMTYVNVMSCHECYIRFIITEPEGEVIISLILQEWA